MNEYDLRRAVESADEQIRIGRERLTRSVRDAHRSGLSQRQIAAASNRSQPEIARLLRFRGTSPRSRQLRRHREDLITLLAQHGLTNVRVFGSVATGADTDDSDIDLLVTPARSLGLLAQARVEVDASTLLGLPVDLALDDSLRDDLWERITMEAVQL
ncbi:nucleotidyltransferase family protein [Kocuria sp.]|uniref:nucleotidyltransferase family protein n=1 Tax=Kocuria sp. TaxID=1871328 RepID=UPI0026E08DA8|nr:nucleotidyltransferase domain-containing protein [Kocuria sp.]MDO5617884.1 nucleotidyltransferase domain-containing protein [Kocuria sp.]